MRTAARRSITLAAATLLGVVGAGALAPPSQAATTTCPDDTCTLQYAYTGALQTFVVPGGVTQVTVTLEGAEGGTALISAPTGVQGGLGGRTTATFDVTPGEVYTVLVGGHGAEGTDGGAASAGGYGGGGASGAANVFAGGSGGGGTFLFGPSGALLAAAGGGGGGAVGVDADSPGGAGGSAVSPAVQVGVGSGGAATTSAGGTGGTGNGGGDGLPGTGPATAPSSLGVGGAGGTGSGASGGGGGGGYYGGGGGSGSQPNGAGNGGSGGGGSGYAAPSATNVSGATGVRLTDGRALIHYVRSASSTIVTAEPAGSTGFGTPVTFTATVTGDQGVPTGTVAFSGDLVSGCDAVPVSGDGTATCAVHAGVLGTTTVTAVYSGDAVYAGSQGQLAYAVTKTSPVVDLTAPADAVATKPVRLVAAASGPTGLPTPTGTVTFLADGTTITGCDAVPLPKDGQAECTTNDLAVGAHTLTVTYSGDDTYLTGNDQATITIDRLASAVAVTADPAAPQAGGPVTYTATVSGGDPPSGTVVFSLDGAAIPDCSAITLDSDGVGRCTTTAPAGGTHVITVDYVGDTAFQPSSGSLDLAVAGEPTPTPGTTTAASPTPTPEPPLAATGAPAGSAVGGVSGVILVLLAGVTLQAAVRRRSVPRPRQGRRG